jgi:hypothetical protein
MNTQIKKTFPNTGSDFSGLYAAKDWLAENGYSYGSLQRGDPIGVLKGDFAIAKWRNLNQKEVDELDGVLTPQFGSFRTDAAILMLNEGGD